MPRSTLSLARVLELLPSGLPPSAFDEALFASKGEAKRGSGDELEVEVTPDRLDLLSEGGLALHLAGALGATSGPVPLRRRRLPSRWAFDVDPSVDPLRPVLAGALVRSPPERPLDEGLLAEAVRFQELLHATIGRDRRAMSLGIYPADRVSPPVRYSLEPLASVRFVPLHATDERSAAEFLSDDPMALRYGALGRAGDRCLTLRDGEGSILSLPPVLNSRTAGEARAGDRDLLLESTGIRARAVREGLGLMLLPFVARGWSVAAVPTRGPADPAADPLSERRVEVPVRLARTVSGEPYSSEEVRRRLDRVRLRATRMAGGWRVGVPPWRPDLMAAIDVVEDVVLAEPIRAESGLVPPSPTRGRRRPESVFRRSVATMLLGLGFAQVHTPFLVSEATVQRIGGERPIPLRNPVSAEFAFLRDRLLPSHLDVLAHNTRHHYPQRFGEVGPVVRRAADAESGGETRYRAGLVLAGEGAGFADAAGAIDYLVRRFDVASVREPAELPATIPGRAARVRTAGEVIAELGEIHPRVLSEIGVPVPVAWAELDLSALWPLVAGDDTH